MAALGLVADEDDDGQKAPKSSDAVEVRGKRPRAQESERKIDAPPEPLVTPEDVEAIKTAAKGLTNQKLTLVFSSRGLDFSKGLEVIPKAQAIPLTKALAAVTRT